MAIQKNIRKEKPKRLIFNKILLYLYLVLNWLLPTIGLLVSVFTIQLEPLKSSKWAEIIGPWFLIVTMPAYLVYARLAIIEIFPLKNKNALLFFIPYIFIFVSYYQHFNENILNFITLDSLPLFLGLNIIFFFGLLKLIYEDNKGKHISLAVIALALVLFTIYFTPVVFLAVYGHKLAVFLSGNGQTFQDLLKFYFTIILVAVFNIKVINNLYVAGKL